MSEFGVEQFANPAWNAGTPRLRALVLRTLLLDALILVLLLVAGELTVRYLLPGTQRLVFTDTLTGGFPKAENSRGWRDSEIPLERPTAQTRILCLGNSTTWGAAVAVDRTYPKQLQATLSARGGGREFLVINAAAEGGSLEKALKLLEGDGLAMQPSLVVLGYSPSMMAVTRLEAEQASTAPATESAPGASSGGAGGALQRLRRAALSVHKQLFSSRLYVFSDLNVRRRLYSLGIIQDRMDKAGGAVFAYAFDVPGVRLEEVERAYSTYGRQLARMHALLGEKRVPLVVVGIPSKFEIGPPNVDNERGYELKRIRIEPLDRIAGFCADLGVKFVDLRPRLSAERRAMLDRAAPWNDLYISFDYTHLNDRGHAIAAEELLKVIDAQGWLASP